jgi:hypothetical protein
MKGSEDGFRPQSFGFWQKCVVHGPSL